MALPLVNIIITTYDTGDGKRSALAQSTIRSFTQHLQYPNLQWIIGDDSDPTTDAYDTHKQAIVGALGGKVEWINVNRQGVGASKNACLKHAFQSSDYVLLSEDDWVLYDTFDLVPHVALLRDTPNIGMVRFGYLGGTITANYEAYNPTYSYWRLSRGSGVYVYSGQVSLRHKRFYDVVGYHTEGIGAGEEELDMCKRFNGAEGIGDIIWPAKFGCEFQSSPFKNIGMNDSTNTVQP